MTFHPEKKQYVTGLSAHCTVMARIHETNKTQLPCIKKSPGCISYRMFSRKTNQHLQDLYPILHNISLKTKYVSHITAPRRQAEKSPKIIAVHQQTHIEEARRKNSMLCIEQHHRAIRLWPRSTKPASERGRVCFNMFATGGVGRVPPERGARTSYFVTENRRR